MAFRQSEALSHHFATALQPRALAERASSCGVLSAVRRTPRRSRSSRNRDVTSEGQALRLPGGAARAVVLRRA
jgi:hypothetical protein